MYFSGIMLVHVKLVRCYAFSEQCSHGPVMTRHPPEGSVARDA